MRRVGPGLRCACARPTIRRSAVRARTIPPPRCSRSNAAGRHVSMFDPTTGKFTLVDTCFPTHHLIFAEDADNTLWLSSGGRGCAGGWLDQPARPGRDRRSCARAGLVALRARHQRQRQARRWLGEPNQPVDPQKDKRVEVGFYSVVVNPQDGTVWGQSTQSVARPISCASIRRRNCRKSTRRRRRAMADAAPTSTATACSGCRWRAVISASSTAASARCSTVRPRPARTAPKAGRCIACLVRALMASRGITAPKAAITPGSTGSTRAGSARTFRSPPATRTRRCLRW